MRRSYTRGLIVAAAVGLLAACASTPQEKAGTRGEFREGGGMRDGGGVATNPAPGLETVYFDFDRADIRPQSRSALKQNAELIDRHDWENVVIEGHADERGSEEYNLALGERRATSVKRYLTSLGVPADSVRTVSYGESRPAKPGHDESAWRYNRRVEFGLPR